MAKKVIVIGSGFAGLSVAGFMAKAGWGFGFAWHTSIIFFYSKKLKEQNLPECWKKE